jgi:hypothetical protein
MEPSPSWEAASCLAPQEFLNILWTLKVYDSVYKSPPQVPFFNKMNPHTTSNFRKIHFNIILPPTSVAS